MPQQFTKHSNVLYLLQSNLLANQNFAFHWNYLLPVSTLQLKSLSSCL